MAKKHRRIRKRNKNRVSLTKVEDTKFTPFLKTNKLIGSFKTLKGAVNSLLREEGNMERLIESMRESDADQFATSGLVYNPLVEASRTRKGMAEWIINRITAQVEQKARSKGIQVKIPDVILSETGEVEKVIYEDTPEHRLKKKKVDDLIKEANLSLKDIIKTEFSSEAYYSREKRILNNLNKIYSKRIFYKDENDVKHSYYKYKEERDIIKSALGTTDFSKMDIEYLEKMPINSSLSPNSLNRAYVLKYVDSKGNYHQLYLEMIRQKDQKGNEVEYKEVLVLRPDIS